MHFLSVWPLHNGTRRLLMSDYYLQSGRAALVEIQESAAFWPSTIQHLTLRRLAERASAVSISTARWTTS
jgi:hypothetical protein